MSNRSGTTKMHIYTDTFQNPLFVLWAMRTYKSIKISRSEQNTFSNLIHEEEKQWREQECQEGY
jgi:hypothetical protein